ncbi:peptide ABC transporter permease [Halobacteriales archaeon QS_4_66_20]|nr:MAG: peptide ABC transporter permease [Halobacteriales archaeon QS_4_66_20]
MTRLRYFASRTVQTVVMLWAILTFLFFFFRLMPGDFADIMLFQGASEEAVEQFQEKWGLTDPVYVQYANYMANFATGDVGVSLRTRQPVWDTVKMPLFNSFILIAPAITVGYLIGGVMGTIFGTNRNTRLERFGIIGTVFIGTVPIFFLGMVLIVVFSGWLGWLPSSGMLSPIAVDRFSEDAWWRMYVSKDFALHYMLPFLTIAIRYANFPTLIMRTSVVEVLNQDFVYYQRITGIPSIRRKLHIARHASLPVITLYPISMTRAVGGLVLLEVVFNWPGIGRELVEAVLQRDFPTVQFIFFLVAAMVIIGNFLIDIIYGIVDPRVAVDE